MAPLYISTPSASRGEVFREMPRGSRDVCSASRFIGMCVCASRNSRLRSSIGLINALTCLRATPACQHGVTSERSGSGQKAPGDSLVQLQDGGVQDGKFYSCDVIIVKNTQYGNAQVLTEAPREFRYLSRSVFFN